MEIKLYKCRGYLFCNYILCEKSAPEIAKECEIKNSETIYQWLRKFNIPIRSRSEAMKIAQNKSGVKEEKSKLMKIIMNEPKVKIKFSGKNNPMYGRRGEKNPNWKENYDELGLVAKHIRMHKILEEMGIDKPDICLICDKKPNKKRDMDLMNIDHEYSNNPSEWFYVCRDCHIGKYHYLAGLVEGVTIKPIPNLIKNLLKLKTREEREKLLKEVIINAGINK